MRMHMFRSSHLELVCPSCRKEHNGNWEPEFWKHEHYQTCTCPHCDYKIFFKTERMHSGHY
ncbi:hypothetical protein JW756_05495 [Candidatus Woesearchaeota archaeon]|nr:hypothetical protein [Candidatus Woesearchaeota archaeon]